MKENWVWMPHPGHFLLAHQCRFHLNTYLGNGYLVSTIGEWWPDYRVRLIIAQSKNIEINGIGESFDKDYMDKIGYEDLGFNRKYESMVFKAEKMGDDLCCLYRQCDGSELALKGYNDPKEAFEGHLRMCEKWDKQ